jgi:hypothetical protein
MKGGEDFFHCQISKFQCSNFCLVLHLDINKTILMSDLAGEKSKDDVVQDLVSSLVWGRISEVVINIFRYAFIIYYITKRRLQRDHYQSLIVGTLFPQIFLQILLVKAMILLSITKST